MDFPSFTFSGIRPSREQESAPDWGKITDEFEFEDGGKTFNEVADVAPIRWEYEVTLPAMSATAARDAAAIYHDFYNTVRKSQPFNFTDKYGTVWTGVHVEEYERTHDAHRSWVVKVAFRLVSFTGEILEPPTVPEDLAGEAIDGAEIDLTWSASTDV
jgi:hypothetical protein